MAGEFCNPYDIDITEIDNFDNLHDAQGLIKEAQDKAAKMYGAKETYYLINGSTCGILSAISAVTKRGDKILVARNCHKAVYHGIFLRQLRSEYLQPEITAQGIQGQIRPESVREALEKNPDAKAVVITSPTYHGVISDIKKISKIVHEFGGVLIVDEAHGAHFGLGKGTPDNAVRLGADLVIVSVHKTLPAFTQTALLHVCSDRVNSKKIHEFLGIYETSSPSYVLMAGIERSLDIVEEQGERLLDNMYSCLDKFYTETSKLKYLKTLRKQDLTSSEAYDFDESKIIIISKSQKLWGSQLSDILLYEYHIQVEMVGLDYVLCLCSLMDTQEGFERLKDALIEIDEKIEKLENHNEEINEEILDKESKQENEGFFDSEIYVSQPRKYHIYETEDMETKEVFLKEAQGKVCGGYILIYPPGIPIIVPGEEITDNGITNINKALKLGLEVQGVSEEGKISVLQ